MMTIPSLNFGALNRKSPAHQANTQRVPHFGATKAEDSQEARYTRKLDELRPLLDRQVTSQYTGWGILKLFSNIIEEQRQNAQEPLVTEQVLTGLFTDKEAFTALYPFLDKEEISYSNPYDPLDWVPEPPLTLFKKIEPRHGNTFDFKGYEITPFGEWVLKQPRLDHQA